MTRLNPQRQLVFDFGAQKLTALLSPSACLCAGVSPGVWQAGREATRANNVQLQPSPAGLLRPDQSQGCSCPCALTPSSRRGRCGLHSLFFFFNSSRIRLFGCREPSPHHQHCPPLSPPPRLSKKFHAARQHRHFWFYSLSSSCCYSTFCFAQGLCYVYVSWIWSLFTFRW